MRYFLVICLVLFISKVSYSMTGAGIIFGEPSGFSFKHNLTKKFAIDAAMGYSFSNAIDFHSDFLIQFPGLNNDQNFSFYFGGGMKFRFYQENAGNAAKGKDARTETFMLGPRFPIGILYFWKKHNLEFFFELAFILKIVPDIGPDFDGGMGVRYYFN